MQYQQYTSRMAKSAREFRPINWYLSIDVLRLLGQNQTYFRWACWRTKRDSWNNDGFFFKAAFGLQINSPSVKKKKKRAAGAV